MAYRIAGTYVLHCSCHLLCPCAIDGPPTGPDGQCDGTGVWHIESGDSNGTDLSGVNFGMYFHVPSRTLRSGLHPKWSSPNLLSA